MFIKLENYWHLLPQSSFGSCCYCCPHFWHDRNKEAYYCVKQVLPGNGPRYSLREVMERPGFNYKTMHGEYVEEPCCSFDDSVEYQPNQSKQRRPNNRRKYRQDITASMPFLSNTDSRTSTSSSRKYSSSLSNSQVQSPYEHRRPSRQSPMASANGGNYSLSAYPYPPQTFSYATNFPPLPSNQSLQKTNSAVSPPSSRSTRSPMVSDNGGNYDSLAYYESYRYPLQTCHFYPTQIPEL